MEKLQPVPTSEQVAQEPARAISTLWTQAFAMGQIMSLKTVRGEFLLKHREIPRLLHHVEGRPH